MSRHLLLVTLFAQLSAVACIAAPASEPATAPNPVPAEVLPVGAAPRPVDFPHFPDRLHAVVWRNWNVVATDRLAKVVGATPADLRAMAAAMGLPPEEPVPAIYRSRLYLTVIRRNWHLLPYDQLLELLDMKAEQLAQVLREDDFLWIKLGSLKPKCERVTFAPPDEATKRREAEIKRIVGEVFGDELAKPAAERRFAFLEEFATDPNPPAGPGAIDRTAPPRFLYSYFGVFGDPLADPSLDPFPDGLLRRLRDLGVNGVWLHVVLRDISADTYDFPEFGAGSQQRLDTLKELTRRAKRYGIGVYLYLNEPRAMPPDFFKVRPEKAGVREEDFVAMCTSDPRVRRWMRNAVADVFRSVPDLAGAFTITASENLTNCASHHRPDGCPRCKLRSGPEIIAEVNETIATGMRLGNAEARLIVWDWGWPDDWAAPTIAKLPKTVWFQSVSEWSLPIERGGVRSTVGEYSISSVGPGPRATRHWKLAQAAGLRCVAKVQLNNSWELSAVPYLPVTDLVAEHCERLAAAGAEGMMLGWSLGGYPSPNLDVARRFMKREGAPPATKDQVLDAIARERFGDAAAPHAREAWRRFSEAFREYPYADSVIYRCPVQLGPANLLYGKPTGYASTMIGIPYDDVKGWCTLYPPEVFAAQFEKLSDGWSLGEAALREAVDKAPPERKTSAEGDLRIARAAGLHFRSVANQARFVLARDALAAGKLSDRERTDRRAELKRIIHAEEDAAAALWRLTRQDSRIGFEASNQYYYLPQDLVEKVLNCRDVQSRLDD